MIADWLYVTYNLFGGGRILRESVFNFALPTLWLCFYSYVTIARVRSIFLCTINKVQKCHVCPLKLRTLAKLNALCKEGLICSWNAHLKKGIWASCCWSKIYAVDHNVTRIKMEGRHNMEPRCVSHFCPSRVAYRSNIGMRVHVFT